MFKPQITTAVTKKIDIPGSDANITIKHIKPGVMQAIVQNSLAITSEHTDNGVSSKFSTNLIKRNRDIVLASVTNWAGFKDAEGRTLKFSALNVNKMMEESDEFTQFVIAEQEKLNAEVEAETEEAEKN